MNITDTPAAWLTAQGFNILNYQPDAITLDLPGLRGKLLKNCLTQQGFQVSETPVNGSTGGLRISIPREDSQLLDALKLALAPELICLDVDGCLIDVSGSFDAVVCETVASYDAKPVTRKEILALRAAGGYNDDIVLSQALLRERGKEIGLEELTDVFRAIYFGDAQREGLYKTEVPLISSELLTRLQQQFDIALVTGRNRQELALAFPILGLNPNTIAITIDDVAEGKPHPEGILTAAAHFKARRVWMLGDNKDDVVAGLNANAVAIGVSSENRVALENAGAALVLDHINELEDLI